MNTNMTYFLCLFFLMLFVAGCSDTRADAEPQFTRDVAYGKGYMADDENTAPALQPLMMDILRPAQQLHSPCPAAILIHGGAFEGGSKTDERQVNLADTLVKNGYVCFLISYRLMRNNPPALLDYPDALSKTAHAAVVDAKTALRHVGANAVAYGIDPKRIALVGASAGAIAALGAGLSLPEQFVHDGTDYPVPPENNPDFTVRAAAIVNLWGTADFFPELFSADAPPIMTVHGGKDFRVGISLLPAENIDAQCKQYGIPHHYYPLPEEDHAPWKAMINGKPLPVVVLEFLDTYLK